MLVNSSNSGSYKRPECHAETYRLTPGGLEEPLQSFPHGRGSWSELGHKNYDSEDREGNTLGWCREPQPHLCSRSELSYSFLGSQYCGQCIYPQEALSSDGLWSSELLSQALSHPQSIAPCHKLILFQFFTFWIIKLSSVWLRRLSGAGHL